MESNVDRSQQNWTTDQLTRAHIQRLQQALQDSTIEAQNEKEQVALLSSELQRLRDELARFRRRDRTKDIELSLSEKFAISPEEPQILLHNLTSFLPTYSTGKWIAAAAARAGDAWICVTTASGRQEELVFTSHTFDNFLRFRNNSQLKQHDERQLNSGGLIETLSEVLPVEVVHYILTGEQPSRALENSILREYPSDSSMPSYIYHKNTRLPSRGIVLNEFADQRCIIVLSFVCTDVELRQKPSDIIAEEESAHNDVSMLISGSRFRTGEYDADWDAVLQQCCQLFLAAVVKMLEFREAEQHRFQGILMSTLEQSLHIPGDSIRCQIQRVLGSVQNLLQSEVSRSLDERSNQPELETINTVEVNADANVGTSSSSAFLRDIKEQGLKWNAQCELLCTSSQRTLYNGDVSYPLALSLRAEEPLRRLIWLDSQVKSSLAQLGIDEYSLNADTAIFETDADALTAAIDTALKTQRPAMRSFTRLSPLASHPHQSLPQSPSHTSIKVAVIRDIETSMRRDQVSFLVLPIAPEDVSEQHAEFDISQAQNGGIRLLWLIRLSATSISYSNSAGLNLLRPASVSASVLSRTISSFLHRDVTRTLWSWLRRSHYSPLSIFRCLSLIDENDSSSSLIYTNTIDEVQAAERFVEFKFSSANKNFGNLTKFVRESMDSDFALVLYLPRRIEQTSSLKWLSDEGHLCEEQILLLPATLRKQLQTLIEEYNLQIFKSPRKDHSSSLWSKLSLKGSEQTTNLLLRNDCLSGDRKSLMTLFAFEQSQRPKTESRHDLFPQLDQFFDRPDLADSLLDLHAVFFDIGNSDSGDFASHGDANVICVLHGRMFRHFPDSEHSNLLHHYYSPLLRVHARLFTLLEARRQAEKLSYQQRAISSLEKSRERTESFRRGLHALARSLSMSCSNEGLMAPLAVADVRRVLCEIISRYLSEEINDVVIATGKQHDTVKEYLFSPIRCESVLKISIHKTRTIDGQEICDKRTETKWALVAPGYEWKLQHNIEDATSTCVFTTEIFTESAPKSLGGLFPRLVLSVELSLAYSSSESTVSLCDIWQRFQSSLSFSIWKEELERFISHHRQILLLYPPRDSNARDRMNHEGEDYFFKLSLQALNAAMLSKRRSSKTQAQQLARPYHLHDYLHNPQLLKQLSGSAICDSFLLLPVSRQSSLRRFHLNEEDDDDDDEDFSQEDLFSGSDADALPSYVHLLKLDGKQLRARGMRVVSEQELPLPRRLNRAVAIATSQPLDDTASIDSPVRRLHRTDASVLSILPEAAKTMVHYLSDLDVQLQSQFLPLLLGKAQAERFLVSSNAASSAKSSTSNNTMTAFFDDGEDRRGFAENSFSSEKSTVILYSPIYPASARRNRNQSQRDQWAQPWSTHYLLVVRSDRVSSLTSVIQLQRVLDAVFRPSLTIATGQSWFECVSGMERLLLASTSLASMLKQQQSSSGRLKTGQRNDSQLKLFNLEEAGGVQHANQQQSQAEKHKQMVKRLISRRSFMHLETVESADESRVTNFGFVSEQFFAEANNILAECVAITKASLGSERYMASAGYLLSPTDLQKFVLQSQLGNTGNATGIVQRQSLLRSFCDTPSQGHTQRWEVGPRKFPCPSTARDIQLLFRRRGASSTTKPKFSEQTLKHFFYEAAAPLPGQEFSSSYDRNPFSISALNAFEPQLHCVELSGAQLQRFLHHQQVNHGNGDEEATAGFMLRNDITVWLLMITAHVPVVRTANSNSNNGEPAMKVDKSEDLVVASMLIYMQTDALETNSATEQQEVVETDSLSDDFEDSYDEDEESDEENSDSNADYFDADAVSNTVVSGSNDENDDVHAFDDSDDLFGMTNRPNTLSKTASFTRKPFSSSPVPPSATTPGLTRRPTVMLRMSGNNSNNVAGADHGTSARPGMSRRVSFSADVAASLAAAQQNKANNDSGRKFSTRNKSTSRSRSRSRSSSPNSRGDGHIVLGGYSVGLVEKSLGRSLMNGLLRVLDVTASLLSSLFLRRVAEIVHERQIERRVGTIADERDALFSRIRQLHDTMKQNSASALNSGSSNSSGAASGSAAAQLLGRSSNTPSSSMVAVTGNSAIDRDRRLAVAGELITLIQRTLDDNRGLQRRAEAAEEQGKDVALRLRQSMSAASDVDRLLSQVVSCVTQLLNSQLHQQEYYKHVLSLQIGPNTITMPGNDSSPFLQYQQHVHSIASALQTLAFQGVAFRLAQKLLTTSDALGGLHASLIDRLRPLALHLQTISLSSASFSSGSINGLTASLEDFVMRLLRIIEVHLSAVDEDKDAICTMHSRLRTDLALFEHHNDHSSDNVDQKRVHDANYSPVSNSESIAESIRSVELAVHWIDLSALHHDLLVHRQRQQNEHSKNDGESYDSDDYVEEKCLPSVGRDSTHEEDEDGQDIGAITGDARIFPGPLYLFRERAREALSSKKVIRIDGVELYRLSALQQRRQKQKEKKSKISDDRSADDFESGSILLETLAVKGLYVADLFLIPVLPPSVSVSSGISMDVTIMRGHVAIIQRVFFQSRAPSGVGLGLSVSGGSPHRRPHTNSTDSAEVATVHYDPSQDPALQGILLLVKPLLASLQAHYDNNGYGMEGNVSDTGNNMLGSQTARLWRAMTQMLPIETTAASLSSSSSIQSSSAVNDHSTGKQKPRHRSSLLALPGRTMENIMVVSPERKGLKSKESKSVTSSATSLAKQTVQAFDLFQQFGVHLSDNFCVQVALSASTLLRGTAAFFPLTSDIRNWPTEVVHGLTSFSASGGEPLLAAEVTPKSSNRLRRRLILLASQQQFDGRDFAVCVSTSSVFQDGHSDSSNTTGICPLHLLVSLIPLQEQNDLSISSSASKRPKYCVFVVEIARAVGAIDALAMSFLVHLVNNHLHVHASEVAKSRRETELKSLAGSLADTSRQMLHQTELAQCVGFLWRRLLSLQSSSGSIVDGDFVTLVSNRRRNISELRHWIKDGKDLSAVICSNSTSSSKLNFVTAELLSLSSSDSMSIPHDVDTSLEQLDKYVVAQGGEGIISLWHKNVKLCISNGIDGFTGCVARASHYINTSVQLAASKSDKGSATVVRTKEFCGSLALRLGCPVLDDLPIAHSSDQNIIEYALYIPLLAESTSKNGLIATDEALYSQVKRNMAGKDQNEELLECVSSKWLLVLMFSTSSARESCIFAINSLSSAEPINIDTSMQQRVPFNSNKVKDLFNSFSNNISVTANNVVGYIPPSSTASNNGTQTSVTRQSIGGLVYALRQSLSHTRNELLHKCLLDRSILQQSLLSCVMHICHAIVQCDMFFARLHLLCQSVVDVAQLLLPTTLSSIAKDNNIDGASLLPKHADFLTHVVLLLQEIMRHTQPNTNEKTKKFHEASDVTVIENRKMALRVRCASLHWAEKGDWKACHVSNSQLLLPQANVVEEDEIVDEHRISLLQKVSSSDTDAVGAAYVSPSYLPVNLLSSVATSQQSAEISDKPIVMRDGEIFRLQNSGLFTILLPQIDGNDKAENINRDAKLLLGITIPSALLTLAQLPSSGTTSKSSPDSDLLVSHCVLELTLTSNNDDQPAVDWNLLESQSSIAVVEVRKEVHHEEKLQELSEQVSSGLCNILFSHPLTLCRDLRDTFNATVFRDTQARRVALLQQAMALFSLEGNSCRTLLQRFHCLLGHALQPLGCITTRLVVRDTAEDLLLYDQEMSATTGSLLNYDSEAPLFSPTPVPVSQSTRSRALSPTKARPLSVSQLQPFSPAAIKSNINDKNDSRFTFSPSPTKIQNSATNSDKVVRFSVESCFDYHEVSGVLTVTFSVASTLHPSLESSEAWSLAEALSSMTNTPTPHSSHNHQKVRFTQKTSEMDERGVLNRGEGVKQGNEEVLETLSRALARRAFELHRGAKNKQKMREKQVALSQANAELQAKNEQVETLEATQSLTLSELRDRSIASERTKHSLLSEQKVLKDMLQQKKEMNAHLQKTLAELRKDADKKEALLVRQVKELKDRLAALESERQKENKELSKAQQKEFAANLQKSEIARQLTDATKAFQSAEQTIRQLKSEIASLEQREKSLAESGDLRLKGFLQRVRALEEDLASARGTNAFLKKQLEAATQQLKTIAEQSGKKLESLQTTMTRSLSLQNMQLQHQLTQSSHVTSPFSRSNSPLPAGNNSASSRHSSPVNNFQVSQILSPKSSTPKQTTHTSSNSPFSPTPRVNTTRPKSPSTNSAKSSAATRISNGTTPIKMRDTRSNHERRRDIDDEENILARDVKNSEEKEDKISIVDGDEDESVEVIIPNMNQSAEKLNIPNTEVSSTRRTFYERK